MAATARRALAAFSAALVALAAGCPEEPAGAEDTAVLCSDGVDNDGDGMTDCMDLDCAPFCGTDGDADADADRPDADEEADGEADLDAEPDGADGGEADGDGDLDADLDAEADTDDEDSGPIGCVDDGECPEAMLCYDVALDGVLLCAPRGRACASGDDCAAGVSCGPVPRSPVVGEFCLAGAGACAADASCPDGFRCEAGVCTDRRVSCASDAGCPWWDRCAALRTGIRVCVPAGLEPCAVAWDCAMELCVDIDGDGDTECQEPTGSTCETNADCPVGVCGQQDGERGVECGAVGPCLVTADCPGAMECVDVNADGDRECQEPGGACMVDADCAERELCWDRDGSGGAECVSGS